MKRLLIIGAGGHAKVVADAAVASGWTDVAFLDDQADIRETRLGFPILGTIANLHAYKDSFSGVVVAIGASEPRLALLAECRNSGLCIVSVVHPSAWVSGFAAVGAGSVVFAQAAINAGARLGVGCIVNTGATVDHDCELEDGVHVCPGAHLAGSVKVGCGAWIGIGAVVRQRISIGAYAIVGAGAAVVADVTSRATVTGVPARQKVQ